MSGWHHRCNGQEFEQAPGDGEGQGNLGCCSPWGHKELDTTEQLNNSSNMRRGLGLPEGLLSPCARSQGAGHHFHKSRGGNRCHRCHLGLQRWTWTAATTEGHTTGCPCLPGSAWGSHSCTSLVGDNGQHMLRKETASIQTKNSPHPPKILNPHKLSRGTPAYKKPPKTTVMTVSPKLTK